MAKVTSGPRPAGRQRTLDIEVANTHSYTIQLPDGRGIISHNTLSLLAGCTPGCHPGLYKFFIRRVRMSSDSPLVGECRAAGYPVEWENRLDGTPNYSTAIPCFPCQYPDGTILAEDLTAIGQLDIIRRLQRDWSDNSVSATVYFKPGDVPLIKEYLAAHWQREIKSISFLPHVEHGFAQAPYEQISEQQYLTLVEQTRPLAAASASKADMERALSPDCAGGACPVR
jgi:hypothetical protein